MQQRRSGAVGTAEAGGGRGGGGGGGGGGAHVGGLSSGGMGRMLALPRPLGARPPALAPYPKPSGRQQLAA
jgi:hypothetical protein